MEIKHCPYCGKQLEGVPYYDCWRCPTCKKAWWGEGLYKAKELLDCCCTTQFEETNILNPIRCSCSPDTVIVCFMSDKELEIKCRHGNITKIVVIGDGKLIKQN